MTPIMLKVLLGGFVVVWLLVCLLLYRRYHKAVWLAASAVASCLFFIGAAIAASFLVTGALSLLPLWAGMLTLCGVHLRAAQRESFSLYRTVEPEGELSAGLVRESERTETYI